MTDAIKEWQQRKHISGLEGPSIEVDEIARIRQRLETKNRQLPQDKPGLIVIYGRSLRGQYFEPNFYESLSSQLEETVYQHRNLILGAIIAYGSTSLPQMPKEGRNYIIRHLPIHNDIGRDVVIIKNRFSNFPVDKTAIDALLVG